MIKEEVRCQCLQGSDVCPQGRDGLGCEIQGGMCNFR